MKNFKDSIFSINSDDWSPLVQELANAEYARAHRYMVPSNSSPQKREKPSLDHPLPTEEFHEVLSQLPPPSQEADDKLEQIKLSIDSFQDDYLSRLKAGFTSILTMLGEIAGGSSPGPEQDSK